MCTNYFQKISLQARQLDDGIAKLIQTWKLPQVLVGRYAERTAETDSQVDTVWSVIKKTQIELEEVLSEMKESEFGDSVNIEQILQEARTEYESLEEQCNSLNTVLAKYGYNYDESNQLDQTNAKTKEEYDQLLSEEMKKLEIEFTPNLSWKSKVKQYNQLTPISRNNGMSYSTTSPIIHNTALNLDTDTSITDKSYICTPMRSCPQDPTYSRHFYNIMKK